MSQGSRGRDPEQTARTLEQWLSHRLNVPTVTVADVSTPKAGFSNETILGTARWTDSSIDPPSKGAVVDAERERKFVARIEPTSHQLFAEPDAIRQAQVMQGLAGHVPVPTIWLTEPDRSVLGAPFFLMDQVVGRVPSDVPSWHKRGWTTQLTPDERAIMHDNALRELSNLHSVPIHAGLQFLERSGTGTALDRYLTQLEQIYNWCEPVRIHGADVINAAMSYVLANRPPTEAASVVWGDARVGNIMFADDCSVAAMVDWEGATLGPPEIDVAWWVMFDEYLCEAQGFTRLEGIPDREGTFARYEQLSGRSLQNIGYYQILAGLFLALINSRLVDLLIRNEVVDETYGAELVTRVTNMTARHL
jgi:aminoglycoside phosphotransferase (APT) family kinase protein